MHAAIADKKEELAELCRRYGVTRLEVFGSAARGTDFDPQTSDVDFLVEFRPSRGPAPFDQFFDLADALRQTLGRPVDLVESGVIDNPYLRVAIDRSREIVYGA
jgi:predicted nucleotidyltransferase